MKLSDLLSEQFVTASHCRASHPALEDYHEKNCTDRSFACLAGKRRRLRKKSKTVGTAPAEAKFSTVSKDEMFSSKLKGLNVYNQKDESIGEITDLAIKNHQVDALILSVGGFLGMGEHYVAVSPSSVNVRYDSKRQQVAGDDEHHQGSAEGGAGVQVSEVIQIPSSETLPLKH